MRHAARRDKTARVWGRDAARAGGGPEGGAGGTERRDGGGAGGSGRHDRGERAGPRGVTEGVIEEAGAPRCPALVSGLADVIDGRDPRTPS